MHVLEEWRLYWFKREDRTSCSFGTSSRSWKLFQCSSACTVFTVHNTPYYSFPFSHMQQGCLIILPLVLPWPLRQSFAAANLGRPPRITAASALNARFSQQVMTVLSSFGVTNCRRFTRHLWKPSPAGEKKKKKTSLRKSYFAFSCSGSCLKAMWFIKGADRKRRLRHREPWRQEPPRDGTGGHCQRDEEHRYHS